MALYRGAQTGDAMTIAARMTTALVGARRGFLLTRLQLRIFYSRRGLSAFDCGPRSERAAERAWGARRELCGCDSDLSGAETRVRTPDEWGVASFKRARTI